MMPLHLSPVDVRIAVSRRQSPRSGATGLEPGSLSLDEQDRLRGELADLAADRARLETEIRRLQEENQDLRDAAELWIRLYERQLTRANEAEERAAVTR